MNKKKLLIVVNVDWFFLSHRLDIALAAKNEGYDVVVATCDTGRFREIEKHGLKAINIPFERSGTNIVSELKTLFVLNKIIKEVNPDVVHNVALKACIYGSIVAKRYRKVRIINAVSGLGFMFSTNEANKVSFFFKSLMKFAFRGHKVNFIFQNMDDFKLFEEYNFATNDNSILIKGSGIDLSLFDFNPPKRNEKIVITLAARMLKDKGVIEFYKASQLLKSKFENKVRCQLIGAVDEENPASLTEAELIAMNDGDYFSWIGFQENIKNYYLNSDIVVLPSYREGLPKSLIEACAIGRPIVTTNAPGCKECVIDGENGFLVEVGNEVELAEKMEVLVNDEDLRAKFGKRSRAKAEEDFSIEDVINKTLSFYNP